MLATTLALIVKQYARNLDANVGVANRGADNVPIVKQARLWHRCKQASCGWHHSWPVLLVGFLWLTRGSTFSNKPAISAKSVEPGQKALAKCQLGMIIAARLRQYCYQRLTLLLKQTALTRGGVEYRQLQENTSCAPLETHFRHCLDERQWNGWFLRRADLDDAWLRRRVNELHQRIVVNAATLPELYAVIAEGDDPYLEFSNNLLKALGVFLAVHHGSVCSLAALLTAGARPDWRNAQGQTPAMVASLRGHDECVRLLKLAKSTHPYSLAV